MKQKKIRLDQHIVNLGLTSSRSRAAALILSGSITCNNTKIRKAGYLVNINSEVELTKPEHPWVSRGGIKLDHAINFFKVDVTGLHAVDVGASTGGFTDVLLNYGVARVYSIDVGYGQLSWKLRKNKKVTVIERQNIRYIEKEYFDGPINFIVCDVSFISLVKALPKILHLAESNTKLIALIKPQFEVGKQNIEKGGVVKDIKHHKDVCEKIHFWLESTMKWKVDGITESPILGPAGNKEFLISARKTL